jgi:hypothetical protein
MQVAIRPMPSGRLAAWAALHLHRQLRPSVRRAVVNVRRAFARKAMFLVEKRG